jgi:hypothetical protein
MSDEDYANSQLDAPSVLVPEYLLAYRHFALRLEDSQLFPMNSYQYVSLMAGHSCYAITGVHDRVRTETFGYRTYETCTGPCCERQRQLGAPDYPLAPTTFTADCGRQPTGAPLGVTRMMYMNTFKVPPAHSAPGNGCSCGFYAHYDSSEDFYRGSRWNPTEGFAYVRTVVELSGTVVMGTKGVRAEKMRLKAMAVDWDKMWDPIRRAVPPDVIGLWPQNVNQPQGLGYWQDNYTSWTIRQAVPNDHEQVTWAVEKASRIYGAEFHEDVEPMYKAHPRPDISNLLPKEDDHGSSYQV